MGQKETAVSGKNRIMIFGPKPDGTYVVEFRTAAGRGAGNLYPRRRSTGDPVFSGANALRIVRVGCSVGTSSAPMYFP
jgi:hypothetical protein